MQITVVSIPLDKAVLCGTCNCISEGTGEYCPVCSYPTLMNLSRCLDIEPKGDNAQTNLN
jgi:hypothetical protein